MHCGVVLRRQFVRRLSSHKAEGGLQRRGNVSGENVQVQFDVCRRASALFFDEIGGEGGARNRVKAGFGQGDAGQLLNRLCQHGAPFVVGEQGERIVRHGDNHQPVAPPARLVNEIKMPLGERVRVHHDDTARALLRSQRTQVAEVAVQGQAVRFEESRPFALAYQAEPHAAEQRDVLRTGEYRDIAPSLLQRISPQVRHDFRRQVQVARFGAYRQPLDGRAVQSAARQQPVIVVEDAGQVVQPWHLQPLRQQETLRLPPAPGRGERYAAERERGRRVVVGVGIGVSPHSQQSFGQRVRASH